MTNLFSSGSMAEHVPVLAWILAFILFLLSAGWMKDALRLLLQKLYDIIIRHKTV